jgi:hypothetical protein
MSDGSPLSRWAFAALRPIVRVLRAAGVTEELIIAHVQRALALHRQDPVRGRIDAPMSQTMVRSLSDLLGRWSRSPEWAGPDGMPRDLALQAGEPSGFPELVRTLDANASPDAALAQLEQFGNVVRVGDGSRVRLLSAVLVHTSSDGFAVEPLLTDLRRFARTIEYNVFDKPTSGPGRMQMSTLRSHVDPDRFAEFDRYIKRTGPVYLTAADDELGRYENPSVARPESFGVGLFVFREDPDEDR